MMAMVLPMRATRPIITLVVIFSASQKNHYADRTHKRKVAVRGVIMTETRNQKLLFPRCSRRRVAGQEASGGYADDHEGKTGEEGVPQRIVQHGNQLR